MAKNKIEEYSDLHELTKFLISCEMLDPMKIQTIPLSFDKFIEGFEVDGDLKIDQLQNEYKIYAEKAKQIHERPNDIKAYWSSVKGIFPNLAKIADNFLSLPVTTCSVERSFSTFRYIYSERRKSFKEAGLKMHLFYAFNKNIVKKMYGKK